MMLLIPLYWDLFLRGAGPSGRDGEQLVGGSRHAQLQTAWFIGLALVTAVLQPAMRNPDGGSLPQSVVTLGEGFLAALIVTLYLAWTRGATGVSVQSVNGAAVVPWSFRVAYYVAVVLLAVIGEQSLLGDSEVLGETIRLNTEATAAMILIPLYFDVVAATTAAWHRVAFYGGLAATPLAIQGLMSDSAPALIVWAETVTEAVLAALVIAAYFDWIRGSSHRDQSAPEAVGRSGN